MVIVQIFQAAAVVSAVLLPGFAISALKPSSKNPEAYMLLACLCSGICVYCLTTMILGGYHT